MKLTRRRIFTLALVSTVGCSAGGSTSPAGILFSLDWPQTRTFPLAAQSLRVRVSRDSAVLVERLFLPGPVTDAQILDLPDIVPLVVEASAFGSADGTGAPLASTSIPIRLARGRIDRITLTLTSAILKVNLAPDFSETLWSLTATGRSATNALVLTVPGQWTWSLNDSALGTLTSSGASATFTPTGFGEARLTVTDTESGKQAQLVHGVTVGEPTNTAPSVASRAFDSPPVGLLSLGSGTFVCLRNGAMSALRADGTTLWESHPDPGLLQLSGPYGSFVAVHGPSGKVALYRTDTGSRFWQAALPSPATALPLFDSNDTLFFPEATPQIEARRLTSGEALWTVAVGGTPLYADAARVVAFDSSSGILLALNTSLGAPLWQLLLPSAPQLLGYRGGVNPLILLVVAGEVQALFASNGARLWTASLSASQGRVTSDKSLALLKTPESITALDAATGATRWTKSGISSWLGSLTNDDLIVVPTTNAPGDSTTIAALKASDGSVRWSAYLPSGNNTLRLFANVVSVFSPSRNQLYALDATTGTYRWHHALTNASTVSAGSGGTLALIEGNQLSLLS